MTKLGPRWLCQGSAPPGGIVTCTTWRSEIPFVLIWACQSPLLAQVPPLLASVWISSKCPTGASGTPVGDCTAAPYVATPLYAVPPNKRTAPRLTAITSAMLCVLTFMFDLLEKGDGRFARPGLIVGAWQEHRAKWSCARTCL